MRFLLLMLAWLIAVPALADPRAPDLVLRGQITGVDHQTYKPVAFEVPAGVTRLTIVFDHTGQDQKTVVDLGLLDAERFRGWSGGNKTEFTLATEDATPSFLPGPIRPGRWTLLLGIPNARPTTVATFEAKVFFDRRDLGQGFTAAPLAGPGWYRGDLHMHTAHSDGSCPSQSGARVPCPVYRTAQAAAARGLDFIAITDHNTTAQYEAMRELQPAFDRLLLIPGREITTFQGHANVFGPTADIDFRLGDPAVPDIKSLARAVAKAGGLMSINHPALPSGEICMGCGWTAANTDGTLFGAVEIINGGAVRASGGSAEGPLSGVPFWETRLNAGLHLTGVGGSDNHDASLPATTPGAVGSPTTVVHAQALSTPAIVQGLREGRVFVDLDTAPDHRLDLHATRGDQTADMGGRLTAGAGEVVTFVVQVAGVTDGRVEVVRDGKVAAVDLIATADPQARLFKIVSTGRRGWVRVNVRAVDGRLLMIGNPIYLN
ncbi:CehA/McbA family metallohydrolase [Caulobacter sp.]|uniref:CehA/McbA family metallohydrolase n=1 Tax=Caulobacter sp. TaxID=78 RepID=UPI003BB1ACAF